MRTVIKWLLAFGLLIVLISIAFSIYANFLLDYSLERLEVTIGAAQKGFDKATPVSRDLYRNVLRDMALEEASRENVDYKKLSLLEMASNSMGEAVEDSAFKRAKIYLDKVMEEKKLERHPILLFFDAAYRHINFFLQQVQAFWSYALERFFPERFQKNKVIEYSSILVLKQADEKAKSGALDEAVNLYRKYLQNYPLQEERGLVAIHLAEVLIRQMKFDEARQELHQVAKDFQGRDEAVLALSKLKQLNQIEISKKNVIQLESSVGKQPSEAQAEAIKLRIALEYLSSNQLAEAQKTLQELQNSKDAAIRKKSKFYLGWIFKMQSQYDEGAQKIGELLKDSQLDRDMLLGAQTQLADIFYRKGEIERSLAQYQQISGNVKRYEDSHKRVPGDGLKEVWESLADLERAKIYQYDIGAEERKEDLSREIRQFDFQFSGEKKSEIAKLVGKNAGLRERAFYALENGRIHMALDLFERDLEKHREDPWTNGGLATTYVLLGDLEQALELAKKAYDLQSDYYTAAVLGYVHGLLEKYGEAEALYREALGHKEDYLPVKFNLAAVYLKTGKYQQALGLLARIERDLKKDQKLLFAKVYSNMGYAYWRMGDSEKAKAKFQEALRVMPTFSVAKNNLSQIAVGEAPKMANLRE